MHFETKAIHSGAAIDDATGAVAPPIHLSTTFARDEKGEPAHGYSYVRDANPNVTQLETALAAIDSGEAALAFASGMAAETAITQLLLKQGDHAICSDNVYGGTFRLFDKIVRHYGVEFSYVTTSDPEAVEDFGQALLSNYAAYLTQQTAWEKLPLDTI